MTNVSFVNTFKTAHPQRDNFLARVFAMLSEEPVRIWSEAAGSPYEYVGRPTLKKPGESRGQTIDFALRSRSDGRIYVSELKCWPAFENYIHLALTSCSQVQRVVKQKTEAFRRFLDMARNPTEYKVTVTDRSGRVSTVCAAGAILVWATITEPGKQAVMMEYGFADVLSVEEIIDDLLRSRNPQYRSFVEQREKWCRELFNAMLGREEMFS